MLYYLYNKMGLHDAGYCDFNNWTSRNGAKKHILFDQIGIEILLIDTLIRLILSAMNTW